MTVKTLGVGDAGLTPNAWAHWFVNYARRSIPSDRFSRDWLAVPRLGDGVLPHVYGGRPYVTFGGGGVAAPLGYVHAEDPA